MNALINKKRENIPGQVSIILPTYNSAAFINKTLESILNQEYRNIELIIIDDCSTDNTTEEIKKYLYRNKFIKLKVNRSNLGVCETLKRGIDLAKGEYIAIPGHDDLYDAAHLKYLVNSLQSNPEASVVFSGIIVVNENNKIIENKNFKHHLITKLTQHQLFTRLLSGNFLCAPSALFRAKYSKTLLGFYNDRLQDYELWLNLLMKGPFIYNGTRTVRYKVHSDNLSRADKRIVQGQYEFYTVLHRILFSTDYKEFLISSPSPSVFLTDIIKALVKVMEYCPPLAVLIPVFYEHVMLIFEEYGINYNFKETVKSNKAVHPAIHHQRLGMFRKAVALNNYELPGKLLLKLVNISASSPEVTALFKTGLFQLFDTKNNAQTRSDQVIYFVSASSLQQVAVDQECRRAFLDKKVIVYSLPQFRPYFRLDGQILFITDRDIINITRLKKKILEYIEDTCRNTFSSNLFNQAARGASLSKQTIDGLIVECSELIPKLLCFSDIESAASVTEITRGDITVQASRSKQDEYIVSIEGPLPESGDITIEFSDGINWPDYFTVNNHLYIVTGLDLVNNNLYGHGTKLGPVVSGTISDRLANYFDEGIFPEWLMENTHVPMSKNNVLNYYQIPKNITFHDVKGEVYFSINGDVIGRRSSLSKILIRSAINSSIYKNNCDIFNVKDGRLRVAGWSIFMYKDKYIPPSDVVIVENGRVIGHTSDFILRNDVNKIFSIEKKCFVGFDMTVPIIEFESEIMEFQIWSIQRKMNLITLVAEEALVINKH